MQFLIGRKTETITVPLGIVIVLHIKGKNAGQSTRPAFVLFFTHEPTLALADLSVAQLTSVID